MHLASAKYEIVPVVAPISADPNTSGKVRNLPCGGGVQHPQIEPTYDDKGRFTGYEIRSSYRRRGWATLRELYEREENPDGWAKYLRYIEAWQREATRSPFPEADLPNEVVRRQKNHIADEFAESTRVKPTTGALAAAPVAESAEQPSGRKPKAGTEVRQ